ncbi:MAG TPA: hypothetical protein VNI60_05220 [Pyrinomonadaceae bacterium]|jgi:hypothetical protein|nr:hypothetical protein [Pyrinomonadaceae bacterium]
MNDKELEKFLNPPPGSKLAAAKEFGIDLTLLVRKLELTPEQRLEELQQAMRSFDELRREAIKSREKSNGGTKTGNNISG